MERRMISAKIDSKSVKAVKEKAKQENRSFSNMLEVILHQWVKEQEKAA